MTVAGVLLAAGGGSRFHADEHKLRHPFRGQPLVAWAIEAVAGAELDDLIVVTGAIDIADLVPDDALVVRNRDWAAGIGASLHAGWVAAEQRGHDAVVIGLGDQPLVTADVWTVVARADHAPIVTATYGGVRRPPVRLAQSVWPLLPTAGDDGARALMRMRPDLVGEIACAGEPADIDTTEDADRWS